MNRFGCRYWVLAALCGCALKPPMQGETGPTLKNPSAENAYEATIGTYSDRAEIYDRLNTRLFTAATYQSWTFREARVQRLALFQHQTPEEVLKNLEVERAQFDESHEFFFGAHVNEPRFDDFDRKNSIWRMALITDVGEALPSSVVRIGRADLNMRAIYPYMGDFWVAYRVRFPRVTSGGTPLVVPNTSKLTLRVASTLGTAEMVFPTQ